MDWIKAIEIVIWNIMIVILIGVICAAFLCGMNLLFVWIPYVLCQKGLLPMSVLDANAGMILMLEVLILIGIIVFVYEFVYSVKWEFYKIQKKKV